ncbi:Uncharacterized protein TCM_019267 [Theobroma cacao]|uniref:RNase H type-1 domain-containing protein n=1 Tax=Theobroma cacao TaxID=3641 RepID=A0A061EHW2_THECC|nr:Uncharacterized protein TCM_019267 [Theobroma cacao]
MTSSLIIRYGMKMKFYFSFVHVPCFGFVLVKVLMPLMTWAGGKSQANQTLQDVEELLIDCDGFMVGVFFSSLGVQDSNYAEFMAILYALRLFSASSYVGSPLSIESNSKIAVTWVEKVDQRLWNKWHIFNEIDLLHLSLISPLSRLPFNMF